MARLFGYFANQADRFRCALELDAAALAVPAGTRIDGWGVGSYQSGEVLLRRTPTESRESVHFRDLVKDLRTDCALVHARTATIGPRTLENTHPFRYRQWLFAHTGSVPGFDVLRPKIIAGIPDFLVRNVRGETDSELIFYQFLAFIFETGRIDDPELDRKTVAAALRETVLALDKLADAEGQPRGRLNAVVTNHHCMVALRRGMPMAWMQRKGIKDCAVCRRPPEITGRDPRRMDHEAFRYVIVASDQAVTPEGWFDLPDAKNGSVVAIDRALDAQVTEL